MGNSSTIPSLGLVITILMSLCTNEARGGTQPKILIKDAQINGTAVKLVFDTGAEANCLFSKAVKRLGLKTGVLPPNINSAGGVTGMTEIATLTIGGSSAKGSFFVLGTPTNADINADGIIGWPFLAGNILRINAADLQFQAISAAPNDTTNWNAYPMATNFNTLKIIVRQNDGSSGIVSIDTGGDWGIALPTRDWAHWKARHSAIPITFRSFYTPDHGWLVAKEAWADEMRIGQLIIRGVPVMDSAPSYSTRGKDEYKGTLGLAGLSRLNVIIDGVGSVVYLSAKTNSAPIYPHNRLGAEFAPTTAQKNQNVAVVAVGGPAYDAGIRDGDILLQVDEFPATAVNGDWDDRFCAPAGTNVRLTLKRKGRIFVTVATLRNILPP